MECLGCKYDLAGLEQRRCPECGLPFDPSERRSYGPALPPEIDEAPDRAIIIGAVITGAWPAATVGVMYLARVAGWMTLGHWPRVSQDDPKHIGDLVDVLHSLGWLGIALSNGAVVGGLFLVVVAAMRQRWRAAMIAVGALLGGAAVAFGLAFSTDTVAWFID